MKCTLEIEFLLDNTKTKTMSRLAPKDDLSNALADNLRLYLLPRPPYSFYATGRPFQLVIAYRFNLLLIDKIRFRMPSARKMAKIDFTLTLFGISLSDKICHLCAESSLRSFAARTV